MECLDIVEKKTPLAPVWHRTQFPVILDRSPIPVVNSWKGRYVRRAAFKNRSTVSVNSTVPVDVNWYWIPSSYEIKHGGRTNELVTACYSACTLFSFCKRIKKPDKKQFVILKLSTFRAVRQVTIYISDFGRLRSYGHFLIPVHALIWTASYGTSWQVMYSAWWLISYAWQALFFQLDSRSSQPSGNLCCGRRWHFRKPALSTDQSKLKVISRS